MDFAGNNLAVDDFSLVEPLNQVISIMLEEPESAETTKEYENISDNRRKHSVVLEALALSDLLRVVARTYPIASMAWATSYFTLQVCF